MMTPFDVWAPMFRAPFSGDVTQEIVPRILSPDIAGSAEIEARIQTDVASYGTQLGKVLEALQTLAAAIKTDLPEIETLVGQIEDLKAQSRDTIRADAERALARLKAVDRVGWRSLTHSD